MPSCCGFACDVKVPPLPLPPYHLFPTSSSGVNFYIYQLPEGLGILAHGIRMQKNPQTRENIFWIFTDFHVVMWVQNPTYTPAWNFINVIANSEINYSFDFFTFASQYESSHYVFLFIKKDRWNEVVVICALIFFWINKFVDDTVNKFYWIQAFLLQAALCGN